ncbi:phosphoribosylanthranilate isomerase [Planctopirus ephydatiae]|nr:phosphoribosylanthranilate isomerase [Planctopirus ephydatiae]
MPDLSTFVKICGVTTPTQAAAISQLGPTALGLNFYRRSSRCVTLEQAREIRAAMTPGVLAVGVFVNETVESMLTIFQEAQLDVIQLHGDEPAHVVTQIREEARSQGLPQPGIYRAFRVGEEGLVDVSKHLEELSQLGFQYDGVLIDARVATISSSNQGKAGETIYGGSGHQAPWPLLIGWREILRQTPLYLAGGLTPANVEEAMRTVHPTGVDTASGVEDSPGVKDLALCRQFIERARSIVAS